MKKLILTLLLACLFPAAYSQNPNELRRLVMHSDVIFAGSAHVQSEHYNDYLSRNVLYVDEIDKIIYNPGGFASPDSAVIFQPFRHLPQIWFEAMYVEELEEVEVKSIGQRYTDLYFIRCESGTDRYAVVGRIGTIPWDKLTGHYIPLITELLWIKKFPDQGERYSRTIDWYIKWNGYPENEFLEYYRSKGIIGDDPALTPQQSAKALEQFLGGK